jgi:hypothetical protein
MAPQYKPVWQDTVMDYFAGMLGQNADQIVDSLPRREVFSKNAKQLDISPIHRWLFRNSDPEIDKYLQEKRNEFRLGDLYTDENEPIMQELGISQEDAFRDPKGTMQRVIKKKKEPDAVTKSALEDSRVARDNSKETLRLQEQQQLDQARQRLAELRQRRQEFELNNATQNREIGAQESIAITQSESAAQRAEIAAQVQRAIAEGNNTAAQTYADRQNASDAAYHQREIDAYNKQDIADTIIEGLRIFGDSFGY